MILVVIIIIYYLLQARFPRLDVGFDEKGVSVLTSVSYRAGEAAV